MGTSNFHNVNASNIFAREIKSDFEYTDFLHEVKAVLGNLNYGTFRTGNYPRPDTELRSFPAIIVADKARSKMYNGVEYYIRIKAVVRSGYYSAVNLDWEIEQETPELDRWYDNPGLAIIHQAQANLWAENAKEELINELEQAYKKLTTPLGVTARFSNGETIYHKVQS